MSCRTLGSTSRSAVNPGGAPAPPASTPTNPTTAVIRMPLGIPSPHAGTPEGLALLHLRSAVRYDHLAPHLPVVRCHRLPQPPPRGRHPPPRRGRGRHRPRGHHPDDRTGP